MQETVEEGTRRGDMGQKGGRPGANIRTEGTAIYLCRSVPALGEDQSFPSCTCRYGTHAYTSRANNVLTVRLPCMLGGTSRASLLQLISCKVLVWHRGRTSPQTRTCEVQG